MTSQLSSGGINPYSHEISVNISFRTPEL